MKLKIHAEEKISFEQLLNAYWETVPQYMGLKDFSEAEAWLIKNTFSYESQEVVLRVERNFEEDVEASITIIDSFNDKKGFITVEDVSGSISSI